MATEKRPVPDAKHKLTNARKPPLGITPKWLWLEHRYTELSGAIARYRAEVDPPNSWFVEEYVKVWLEEQRLIKVRLIEMGRDIKQLK